MILSTLCHIIPMPHSDKIDAVAATVADESTIAVDSKDKSIGKAIFFTREARFLGYGQ